MSLGLGYALLTLFLEEGMRLSFVLVAALVTFSQALSEIDPRRGPPGCIPVSERRGELGCYVVALVELGELSPGAHYWHLDTYRGVDAAEAAKSKAGAVVQAFGRIWLLTIADQHWRASGAEHVAEIGPLMVSSGSNYTASFLEAVMFPGAESSVHHHPGPEALYPLEGEECMETPEGRLVGRPGEASIIVPGYVPHKLTIAGSGKRASLGLILHKSSEPIAIMEHQHGWRPKGLCSAQ